MVGRSTEELRSFVHIAATAQRFLDASAPISTFSADSRAVFWRSLVAGRPGVLAGVCDLSPPERRVLFGSLVFLERCSAADSQLRIREETQGALLYCLLSANATDAASIINILDGLSTLPRAPSLARALRRHSSRATLGLDPKAISRAAITRRHQDWNAREDAALDANRRLALAATDAAGRAGRPLVGVGVEATHAAEHVNDAEPQPPPPPGSDMNFADDLVAALATAARRDRAHTVATTHPRPGDAEAPAFVDCRLCSYYYE